MVSPIYLYRGNLHQVPDQPREWPMPPRTVSLRDFRILTRRRDAALARLRSDSSDLDPNPNTNHAANQEEEVDAKENKPTEEETHGGDACNRKTLDGGDLSPKSVDGSDAFQDVKPEGASKSAVNPTDATGKSQDEMLVETEDAKPEGLPQSATDPADASGKSHVKMPVEAEASIKVDVLIDKEKRKKEIQDRLQTLNGKKHNLVQLLKQILNVEEELKRRSSPQGVGNRPSVPLQVDAMNDSGSMTRLATPRLGSDGNLGHVEPGEADDLSNQNVHSRHLLRTSSTSPSSDSPHRRPALTVVPHPPRASLAVVGSPSRFAPPGHQGHPTNPPTVSVSGTSYMASSPSPAASGGTSAFRDCRQPSPWN
ncbi:uncharacterized protein LOC127790686 [Diospyros lotus]|uniref:uncharacterized protein LOC127790686 n=1 Tax=Diospyros lotus TaxID=55363 RepID=UPI00224ECB11|nr:uncharacterized protein LOC127790686 [Diospyros lotus]